MAEPMMLKAEGVTATPFEIPGSRGQFRIQILNEDAGRGVVTSIVHIPAGGFIPAHFHEAGPEMHFVLAGDLIERGERLGPGAFLTHAPGVVHGPHESEGGAQVLTVQSWQSHHGRFDFHIAEGEAPAGDGAKAGEALASEGIPEREAGGSPQERKATEQSLGRGYG